MTLCLRATPWYVRFRAKLRRYLLRLADLAYPPAPPPVWETHVYARGATPTRPRAGYSINVFTIHDLAAICFADHPANVSRVALSFSLGTVRLITLGERFANFDMFERFRMIGLRYEFVDVDEVYATLPRPTE